MARYNLHMEQPKIGGWVFRTYVVFDRHKKRSWCGIEYRSTEGNLLKLIGSDYTLNYYVKFEHRHDYPRKPKAWPHANIWYWLEGHHFCYRVSVADSKTMGVTQRQPLPMAGVSYMESRITGWYAAGFRPIEAPLMDDPHEYPKLPIRRKLRVRGVK